MKVCTITCHNAVNHGARLQACALLRYLHNQGLEAEVIDYRPDYMRFGEKVWYIPSLSLKEWAKLFLRFKQRADAVDRHAAFEEFTRKYIPHTERIYKSVGELRLSPPKADVYIAGSDQIWNTEFCNGTDAAYYLDFGDLQTRRISYAASFAVPMLKSESEPFVKSHLSAFDAISVREASGMRILSSLGYGGEVVSDPVFLLSADEWDNLLGCKGSEKSYVLVYDMMGCDTIKHIAKRIAGRYGCEIYSIGSRRLGYADRNFTKAAPDMFVELVRNARCVVSNSFHGTAFAMIYHRDFFVVERSDGLNERMKDILARCGLQSRLVGMNVSDGQLSAPVSYEMVDKVLQREIAASKTFLREALTIE